MTPSSAQSWITLGSNWLCRYWASFKLTHMTYEVPRDPAALQHITHIFSSTPPGKGVWLWWLDQVCALVRRGCCCFSRAYQGVTVALIYGLLLKQCSLSPTHYEFTFTYITACRLHTNFQKKKGRSIFSFGWGDKRTTNTLERSLRLPFSCCTLGFSGYDCTPPKKTNLNVKVSIINHSSKEKGAPCKSRQCAGTMPVNKVPCVLEGGCGGECGRHLAKWDAKFEYVWTH